MSESDCSAGSPTLFDSMPIGATEMTTSIATVGGVSRLAQPINIAEAFRMPQLDRALANFHAIGEQLLDSDLTRGIAAVMREINQQWAKPLTDLGLQASLISKSVTMDMNLAAEALGKAAVMLGSMPKAQITLPHTDVVSNMPAVIIRRNRPFWSDELFEEDDPPSYSDESLEGSLLTALDESFLPVSANEFRESFRALYRKPNPNLTGAISHAHAGFLAVARVIDRGSNADPSEIVARHRHLLPKPLGDAALRFWGFSSQYGRKVSEGKIVEYKDAETAVYGIATITLFLIRAARKSGSILIP